MPDKPVQCVWARYGTQCANNVVNESMAIGYVRCPFTNYPFQDKIGMFCQWFMHQIPVRYDVMAGNMVIKSFSTADTYTAKNDAEEYLEELSNIHIEMHEDR